MEKEESVEYEWWYYPKANAGQVPKADAGQVPKADAGQVPMRWEEYCGGEMEVGCFQEEVEVEERKGLKEYVW